MDSTQGVKMSEKKNKKSGDKSNLSRADYFRTLAKHVNNKFTNLFKGEDVPFYRKYYVERTEEESRRLLMEIEPDVVKYVADSQFKADIVRFIEDKLPYHEYFPSMTTSALKDFFDYWMIYTTPIDAPKSFKFNSEEGLCFSKLDFDPVSDDGGMCPLFNEICQRIETNEQAFRAFIGSLFFSESDRQQYLWIHGEGQNGKGAVIRFLQKLFGKSFASRTPPPQRAENNFWNNGLLGKRIVVFSDCEHLGFPTSEKFKMLTGGDAIPTERKGKDEVTSKIDCKFMFASNHQLSISGQKSDQRRAIYCRLGDIDIEADPTYERRLWEEAKYIIGWCIDEYKELCPNHIPIPVDDSVNRDLAEDSEGDMQAIWDQYFNLKSDAAVSNSEIERIFKIEYNGKSYQKIKRFRRWVKYYLGLKFDRIYVDRCDRPRGLIGAALKEGNCYLLDKSGKKYSKVDSSRCPVDSNVDW
jgi:hypothetical protein